MDTDRTGGDGGTVVDQDYPLEPVPAGSRKSLGSLERGTTAPAHEFHFTAGIRPFVALGTRG